jgi:hypothetical protein
MTLLLSHYFSTKYMQQLSIRHIVGRTFLFSADRSSSPLLPAIVSQPFQLPDHLYTCGLHDFHFSAANIQLSLGDEFPLNNPDQCMLVSYEIVRHVNFFLTDHRTVWLIIFGGALEYVHGYMEKNSASSSDSSANSLTDLSRLLLLLLLLLLYTCLRG